MASLMAGLTKRRRLFEKKILTQTVYRLERVMVDDGGGVSQETFVFNGQKFPGRVQPIFRRPDATDDDAVLSFVDLRIVYPATETIEQVDRLQVNDRIYTIRNIYDNVDDAMTNQVYVAAVPGKFPPVEA